MDFLKALFSGNALTYEQLEQAINAHNGNEANKENQIKLGNLGTGQYVDKGKYDAEVSTSKSKDEEIENYKNAIADLQKTSKNNEAIQQRIKQLEDENEQLKKEQKETKLKAAIKVALLSANADADDIDYLTYKLDESLKEKGEKLELDDNDNIKGWDARLESLKTQFPKHFKTGEGGDNDFELLGGNGLPKGKGGESVTKEQFLKMTYEERVALKQKNEKLYQSLKG